MIYTDVGCCCSLFDVVSSVVFSFCQQVSKQIVCFFFFFFFSLFFFFFSPLSLSPILLFSLFLFPFFVDFPTTFFFYFFLFIYLFIYLFFFFFSFLLSSFSLLFLCPLVLSVTVWLSKRVYKIKLINYIKKKDKKIKN